MSKYVDLHIHSNYSDGSLTPKEIIEEAKRLETKIIAITDHDTFDSLQEIKQISELERDLLIVPGIEISSYIENKKLNNILIHILGYGVNEDSNKLNEILKYMKDIRIKINNQYIEKILEKFPQIKEEDLSNINRSRYFRIAKEIISILINNKVSEDIIDNVKKFCRYNPPKYENYDVASNLVIDAIISAGGIPILAHPTDYKLRDIELKRIIKSLINMGVLGIETYYSEATVNSMKKLRMMAESYKILYSCGSDFHSLHGEYSKLIGHGINDNLRIKSCSLEKEIIQKELYLKKN